MRTIGVITTSRAEYGILRPVLKEISADPDLSLKLFVGGAHLSPEFGSTVEQIEFPISERVECLMSSESPEGISKSMGLTCFGFAQAFAHTRPDILLITGDRFEAAAIALAAVPFKIPIAHLGGGDLTIGAFDESMRHAITKMAHLHFCYAEEQARRVLQMGEDPKHVIVTGNPALDGLNATYGEPLARGALVVIFHPVTLEYEHTDEYIDNLLDALRQRTEPIVFILPNADTAGRKIIKKMRRFPNAQAHANLIPPIYYDLLRHARAMIGNSSSALMEAPSFDLPAVNIGTRQKGRLRGGNVIDVGYSTEEITSGIERALKLHLQGTVNPYGDGHSAPRIVQALKNSSLDIIEKDFITPIAIKSG
ncbi:MAG TPA: UDP-N-acetylglucosamine 2-epimerase [Anaerolineales bacterium]|nr:UDP-N-acetylglucosamine 2-epimerase [Anaerolineales bacterium]